MNRQMKNWMVLGWPGILCSVILGCGGMSESLAGCNSPTGVEYGLILGNVTLSPSWSGVGENVPPPSAVATYSDDAGGAYVSNEPLPFSVQSMGLGETVFTGFGVHQGEGGSSCSVSAGPYYFSSGLVEDISDDRDGETPPGGNNEHEAQNSSNEPVDARNGNCYFSETDLVLPCPGIPLVFARRYNSVQDAQGTLGRGWRHTYEWQVKEFSQLIPAKVEYVMPLPNGGGSLVRQPPVVQLPRYGNGSSLLLSQGMSVSLPAGAPLGLPQNTRVILQSGETLELDGQASLTFTAGQPGVLNVVAGSEGATRFVPAGVPAIKYADGHLSSVNLQGAEMEFKENSGTLPAGTQVELKDGGIVSLPTGGTFRPDSKASPSGQRYWWNWSGPGIDGDDNNPFFPAYKKAAGIMDGGYGGLPADFGIGFMRRASTPFATAKFDNYLATIVISAETYQEKVVFSLMPENGTPQGDGSIYGVSSAQATWSLTHTAGVYQVMEVSNMVSYVVNGGGSGLRSVPTPPENRRVFQFSEDGAMFAASVGGVSFNVETTRTVTSYLTNAWVTVCMGDGDEVKFRRASDGTLTAPPGNSWGLSLTQAGYRLKLSEGLVYQFDGGGSLQNIADAWGNQVSLEYTNTTDNGRLLTRVEHSKGPALELTYQAGRLSGVLADTNLVMSFAYNNWGQLTNAFRHTSQGDTVTLYDYAGDYLNRRTNMVGDVFAFSYEQRLLDLGADTNGTNYITAPYEYTSRCIGLAVEPAYYKHTLSYGSNTTSITYERGDTNQVYVYFYTNGALTQVTDPGGLGRTVYGYDTNNNITSTKVYGEEPSEFFESRVDFDAMSLPVRTAFGYKSDATQSVTHITWDPAYKVPTSITDPAGNLQEVEYEKGRPILVREWAGATQSNETRLGYTTNGLLAAVTNANGHFMTLEYDDNGFLKRLIPQIGPAVDCTFTPLGHLQQVTLAGGRTVQLDPDELGRVRSVTYPNGTQVHAGYDSMGGVTNAVDPLGRVTRYLYAPTHKLAGIVQVLEGPTNQEVGTTFDYDNQFNTLRIKDALSRGVEAYQLDIHDRPVCVTNVEGQVMTATWGVGDFVKSVTRFDGTVVSNHYDAAGRVVEVAYPGNRLGMNYFANSLPRTLSNGVGVLEFAFDGASRLTNAVGVGPNAAMDIGYYPAGQVSNVTTVAGSVTYRNDEAERLVSQESPVGAFQYSYNPSNGLVESVAYPNGMQARYAFDVMDQVTGIEWVGSDSNVIRSLGYGYDAAGMITNVTRETGESTSYAYDSLYRLIGESTLDSSSNQVHGATWNYDLVGNRLSKTEDGIATAYTLGQGNRLASFGAEGAAYQDAAGCVTALVFNGSSRLDLAWNSQYQMTAASTNGVVAKQFSYDATGRRVLTVSGGVTNWHVYAGPHVVADLDAAGAMVRSYVWGPGIDNLLSMTTYGGTTNTYYALKDHLGSVLALTDGTGNIVESYRYDAWGRTTVYAANGSALTASAVGNRYCWQGREYNFRTGLYYFRARWYEPVTGRFLSNDPIGISGGLNQYVFCANNPVNFTDAFGLDYRFIQEWGTPHTIVEIKGKDGVSRFYEWTGLGRTEDPISNLIDIDLGIWVPGHWYQPDRTPRGISLPWHKTKSCEDKALINKFDDLIGAENLSYNLYRNNSFQAPRRVVDSVLHPQPPPAGVFQIPNWNTH